MPSQGHRTVGKAAVTHTNCDRVCKKAFFVCLKKGENYKYNPIRTNKQSRVLLHSEEYDTITY
jgi:predicted transcriptional regulator